MPKHLLLLRHAKSSWKTDGMPDHERPLSPRGQRDAPHIGKALGTREPLPDLVLCSTALRTRQTVEAVLQAVPLSSLEVQFLPNLYAASSEEIMRILRTLPDACRCVLVVGHNPGFEELLARLTGEAKPMPPAALACIALDIANWDDVEDGRGRLEWLLTPKQLEDDAS